MKKKFSVRSYFDEHEKVFNMINHKSIDNAIKLIKTYYKKNKNIFTCGNGGSAYNASHFVTDWNKMMFVNKNKKIKTYSLCDNIGILTAYGNDLSYEKIFSGQLGSIMRKGDLLICISGSGNSKNIIDAIRFAKKINCKTLALVGFDGGIAKKISDYNVHVPSFDMQICEDMHLMIGHMIMKSLLNESIN